MHNAGIEFVPPHITKRLLERHDLPEDDAYARACMWYGGMFYDVARERWELI